MAGTVIAQGIQLGISPVLTRIYGPNEFGVFALYMSVASLFSIVATGRYEMAIMLPANDDDAANLLALSLMISAGISLVALLVVSVFGGNLAAALGDRSVAPWLYLIPVSIMLTGSYQAFNYWSNRNKKYRRLSGSRVIQYGSAAVANMGLGLWGWGVGGLIGGSIFGQLLSTLSLGWQATRDGLGLRRRMNAESLKVNAKRYKDFPLINSLHAFMDVVQTSGANFIISHFFGQGILGQYSLTMRILKAPLYLIGASLSQVFLQKATEVHNQKGDLQVLVRKAAGGLVLTALPIFTLIYLAAPALFSLVFGERWRVAGEYARILSPWLFLNFVVSPLAQIPIITNRQKEVFGLGLLGNSLIVMSVLYGGLVARDIKNGLWLLSITQVVYLSGALWWVYKISGRKDHRYA